MAELEERDIFIPGCTEESSAVTAQAADGIFPLRKVAAVILATDTRQTPVVLTRSVYDKDTYDDVEDDLFCGLDADGEGEVLPRPLQTLNGTPLVRHVVNMLADCGAAPVIVIARDFVDEIGRAIEGADAQLVRWDERLAANADSLSGGFELSHLSCGQLANILAALDGARDVDSVIIACADQPQVEPRHIAKLRQSSLDRPQDQAFFAWAEWRVVAPTLVRIGYLRHLCSEGFLDSMTEGGYRHTRLLPTHCVSFGEDKLVAPHLFPEDHDDFMAGATRSALELVRAARAADTKETEPEEDAGEDELLDEVRGILAEIDRATAHLNRDELDRWDAWGHRARNDFPMLASPEHDAKLVYLDAAATSQRPYSVIRAELDYAANFNANIYRGVYEASSRATAGVEQARAKVADFIGAEDWQVVFTSNTTGGCALVARCWGELNVGAGDTVLISIQEHHSNMLPWRMLADRVGANVEYIRITDDGRIDMEQYRDLLKLHPKIVCAAQIPNVLGLVAPIAEMVRLAHDAGARFMLDAAQSAPHMPIDVGKLGVDFLALSGHKLYGPTGVGVLYIDEDAAREMEPRYAGGGTISHVELDSAYLRSMPYCYEFGTPPIGQIIGLGAAIDYLQLLGMENVREHDRALTRYAIAALDAVTGTRIWGDQSGDDAACGLFSITSDKAACVPVACEMAALGIAIRAATHCAIPLLTHMGSIGTNRLSVGLYNTLEDIDAFAVALALVTKRFGGYDCRA